MEQSTERERYIAYDGHSGTVGEVEITEHTAGQFSYLYWPYPKVKSEAEPKEEPTDKEWDWF